MVISQPAVVCLEAARGRLIRALWPGRAAAEGLSERAPAGAVPAAPVDVASPATVQAAVPVAASFQALVVPVGGPPVPESSGPDVPAASGPLTAAEVRARATALRALLLARQRRYDAAETAFVDAARFDPALDLASVPTFWALERGGHEAAIRAYERVGRPNEAALLAARVRRTFRPRMVPNAHGASLTRP